jgi:N-acyl amino acid synthase FeeM
MSVEVRRSAFSAPAVPQDDLSDRLGTLFSRIEYRRADSPEEREAIFRLRHEAYLREGAIAPNHTGRFADADDEAENAYLVGLYIDGELASALRLHVATKDHPDVPSFHVFSDILQPRLDAGRIILGFTRFVADERLSRLHSGLPYATLRPCMLAAEYFHADEMLVACGSSIRRFISALSITRSSARRVVIRDWPSRSVSCRSTFRARPSGFTDGIRSSARPCASGECCSSGRRPLQVPPQAVRRQIAAGSPHPFRGTQHRGARERRVSSTGDRPD